MKVMHEFFPSYNYTVADQPNVVCVGVLVTATETSIKLV